MNTRAHSRRFVKVSLATLLAYAAFHGWGYAQMFNGETIGVNFQGTTTTGGVLGIDAVTGVISQADWNNINFDPPVPNGLGTGNLPVTTTALSFDNSLNGSSGTSAVSLLVQAAASSKTSPTLGGASAVNSRALLNGIIVADAVNPAPTFQFGGLAAGNYQVIVYTMMNAAAAKYSMTLGETSYYQTAQRGAVFNGTFLRGTNTVAGLATPAIANYVQFDSTNVTGGLMNLGFNWLGGSTGVGIAGIQLKLVKLIDVWSGSTNGNWDVDTTANWNGNGAPGKFQNADLVAFGDLDGDLSTVFNRTITVAAGGVTVGSIVGSTIAIDNSFGDYTFNGGSINGASSLTKSGTSELNLDATNGYTGGTVIKGGIVRLGAVNALGSGGNLSLASGTTLDLNSRNQTVGVLTANGMITTSTSSATSVLTVASGTGASGFGDPMASQISDGSGTVALVKNTAGTLSMKGANAFSGGTTISGGTLSIGNNAALGSGPVTLSGGATLSFDTGVGLSEGLLAGAFNTTAPNPNTNVTATTRLAGVTLAQQPFPTGIPDNSTAIYTGSIFNPSAVAATWTFAENFDDSVLLKINGATILNDTNWNNPTRNSVVMAPGYNAFELRLGQGGGGVGPVGGSVAGLFGVAVNTTGADLTNPANYTALPVDNGTGNAFVGGFASAITNAIALTGSAAINVGNNQLGAPTKISLTSVDLGLGNTLTLTAAAVGTNITATGTTFSGSAGFNVGAGVTYNAGIMDGGAGAATITKTGVGTLRVSQPAASLVAGSAVNVTVGTLSLGGDANILFGGSANAIGASNVSLAAGTTLSLDGFGGGEGLLGKYYDGAPANTNNSNPNFNDYTIFTNYFAGLTPTVTTLTTTGGKLDFNFSNANADGSDAFGGGAPFNGGSPTRPAYGFANADNIQATWTGLINITNPGIARFESRSDDGTMIFIDGVTVVNNNLFQGATTVGADVVLTAGYHEITLGFYEGGGGAGALFQWNQNGDALHTLLNSEVITAGSFAGAQAYTNNVAVTGNNATIAVNNSPNASIGALTLGGGVTSLNVTSSDTLAAGHTLTVASISLSGSTTFNVTNGPSGSVTFAPGTFTGSLGGAITKTGNGILRLDQANTYAGGTNVNEGTLLVTNTAGSATGNGLVTVQTTGKLTGDGTIDGSVSVLAGGNFTPGTGAGTALTIGGAMTVAAGGVWSYDLAAPGVNATANITGALTLNGAEILNVNKLPGFSVGTYILASAASVANGAAFTFNQTGSGGLPGFDLGVTVQGGGTQLVLEVESPEVIWTGTNGNAWDNSTLNNWTPVNPFVNGYTAKFTDAGSNTTIALANGVQAWSAVFDNSLANQYTINGNIGGPGSVTKINTGTVTFTGANTYTGGTVISGGRLVIQGTAAAGSNFVNDAQLEFNVAAATTKQLNGGSISGTGILIKSGPGVLMLGANGSPQTIALAGLIDVQGGVLRNEFGNSAWGSNTADLAVAAGAIFDLWDGNTSVDALTGAGTVNKGWSDNNTLTIGANNGSGTFSGTIENNRVDLGHGGNAGGDLTVTKVGTGTQTLSGVQTYKTLTTNGGVTNIDSALGTGASILNANATTNIAVSQTLAELNIGTEFFAEGAQLAAFGGLADTAVVPEPGTLGLLTIGALGILGRRRRK